MSAQTLGERGLALWQAYADSVDARGRVMLEEACRMVDRLDKLDELLRGDVDKWARIARDDRGRIYLRIDEALGEARQQVSTLRQVLASLPLKDSDGDDDLGWVDDLHAQVFNTA